MLESKFLPITFRDKKAIAAHYEAANKIADALNKARETYIDLFGNFCMPVFLELFSQKRPFKFKRIAIAEYMQAANINIGDIDPQKAIEMDLIKLPDFGRLSNDFSFINRTLEWNHHSYIEDISDFFDSDLQRFIKIDETKNNKVKQKIDDMFTVRTKNEQENEFIRDVESLADMYHKFIYKYKIIPKTDIPGVPFYLSDVNNPDEPVLIPLSTLKKYRNQIAAEKTAKHFLA